MRTCEVKRATTETNINLKLSIDGSGQTNIQTGVGFLNHMLVLMTKHGQFDLDVCCEGDLDVDQHHTVEDIGIVLGQVFSQCLGTKEQIVRYATKTIPMDETLANVTLDISGRPYLVYNIEGLKDKVGQFDTELVEEFFRGFTNHAQLTLHINLHYGTNSHHIIEAIFKAFGRALAEASTIDEKISGIPSTKGLL